MGMQVVVFDLDGTLLDSLTDIADAANDVLLRQGCAAHPVNAYRAFIGNGVKILFERALPPDQQDASIVETCVHDFAEAYRKCEGQHTTVFAGIPELLTALADLPVKTAVLSNKPHALAVPCVEEFLPQWPFDLVLGQRDHVPPKPDPSGALEILQATGAVASSSLYLGDTAVDMQTATAAGMVAVGVSWGFRPPEELVEGGAQHVINHPTEMLSLLT